LLLSEAAAGGQSSFAASRLGHDAAASLADDDGLSVAKDGSDLEAVWAFDVHEKTVWALHESLLLVLGFLAGETWVEKVDSERHF
jgi:hypothetical protein